MFYVLHTRAHAFAIPNPWDVGTARVLAHLGFEALATTSAGFAFSAGLPDGAMERDATLAHAAAIVAATDLPVSADLENGFGDAPEDAAETIRLGAAAGLAGGSIEDSSRRADRALYDVDRAADRIRAAAEVIRGLPFRFNAHRAGREFSGGPARPRRHHSSIAGLPGGGGRRAIRARAHDTRRDRDRGAVGRPARQRPRGDSGVCRCRSPSCRSSE